MLSVPIPIQKEQKLVVKYFPASLEERPKEFILGVGEQVSLNEVKQRLMECLPAEHSATQPFFCRVKYRNQIELIGKDRFIKAQQEKGEEICIY